MWELRWVLFGLGAAVIIGVYLWGKGLFQPSLDDDDSRADAPESTDDAVDERNRAVDSEGTIAAGAPERIITLRFVHKSKELSAEKAILALRAAGLRHGRYGIFHRTPEEGSDVALFSVASLTEPGSFDLTKLSHSMIPGMSFFMILPGTGDPVARFDMMVETARTLARDLDSELHDERGSSWSIQRERYVREELIEYRHQHFRA
jgi:cell division protein ZipA